MTIPQQNFAWTVGLLSAWVCYSFFVFRRFSLPRHLSAQGWLYYLPVFALLIALPVDIGVFVRLIGAMGEGFAN